MSKFIPKKGESKYFPKESGSVDKPLQWSTFMSSDNSDAQEDKKREEYINHREITKNRIESIPLENLAFKDLYQFPFHETKYSSWVYDNDSNFIFQFEFSDKETRRKTLEILNGELLEYKRQEVTHDRGEIFVNGQLFILIRGWGNLTGTGAYNLKGEYAAKIQDTLAEYIVEKLKL